MAFTFLTSPNIGDSIYANGTRYYYNGTAWELAVKNAFGSRGNKTFTSTANQTTYQCPFSVDNSEVFINGIKISDSDYTVNGDGLVTLNTAPTTGSEVEVIGYGSFDISNIVAFDSKADKATTLVGYGITDAYTKTQTDSSISTAVANLVNSAPSTLDTLNELATALGNDANFSTTVANNIATKAPIASPTFTGTVSGITKSMVGLGNVSNDAQVKVITSTANKLVKFSDTSSTITNSVIYDDGTNVGIGTTVANGKLNVSRVDTAFTDLDSSIATTTSQVIKTYDTTSNSSSGLTILGKVNNASASFYGLRINSTYGSTDGTRYGIYDESPRSYFAGNVGIGTSSPNNAVANASTLSLGGTSSTDSGVITFQVNDTYKGVIGASTTRSFFVKGSSAQDQLVIDSSGNVGIGVTPSGFHKLELPTAYHSAKIGTAYLGKSGGDYPSVGYNFRATSTNNSYLYDINDTAYRIRFGQNNVMGFDTALSGTAGNAITWNQAMTLTSSGNLLVGTTTDNGVDKLQVNGNIRTSKLRADDVIEKKISFNTGTETNILKLDDGNGNYGGKITSFNNGGYNQDLRIYTTDTNGNNEKLHLVLDGRTRSLQTFGQQYATWTETMQTPNGGAQVVRVLEDCFGRWLVVGKFAADASTAISYTWSTVRGLSTSTSQSDTTAFSADFGDAFPTEVRVLGATDFTRWKDTRTIDWVYRVPSGRTWATFFNNGSATMDQQSTRYGFGVAGAYDGFGRWNNPAMSWMGMSDNPTTNPSSAYTTPTANAINWYTAQDAKLAVVSSGNYAGQDYTSTSAFGYDDSGNNFFDAYPSTYSNHSGTKQFTSAVWILIKLN